MAFIARGGGGKKKKVVKKKNPYGLSPGWLKPGGFTKDMLAGTFSGTGGFQWVAPPGGGGGGSNSGIVDDYLNQARADFGAASAADAASRDAALRRFIISYGEVPDFNQLGISKDALGYLQKALDPRTVELAKKNYAEGTAIKARMDKANADQNRRIPALLAGRGMLRSGQTGWDLKEQAQNYKIQGFDTLNEMLGGIEGTVGNFLNAERERQRELARAAMEAAQGAYSDFGDAPGSYGGPDYSAISSLGQRSSGTSGSGTRVTKRYRPKPYRGSRKSFYPKRISGRQA